jgi:enoyl-CoA hydratase/carnithine racemase
MITSRIKNNIVILEIRSSINELNLINEEFLTSLERIVHEYFETDHSYDGFILTSSHTDFMAGADLNYLGNITSVEDSLRMTERLHRSFRLIEKSKRPVVAAINGTALGGGLELALACHHIIVLNKPEIKLGFPEVTLGLLPGAGGTQRLSRKTGFETAIPLLIEGKIISPEKACELKIIEELAFDITELMNKAEVFIRKNSSVCNPWDSPSFRLAGSSVQSPRGYQFFPSIIAKLMERTWMNYPAPQNIIKCVYEGLQLPFDKALEVEQKYFAELVVSKTAKNMMRLFLLSRSNNNFNKDFVARIKNVFQAECSEALKEGVSPVLIENAARAAGMTISPELSQEYYCKRKEISLEEMKLRLLSRQVLEAFRCLDEGMKINADTGDLSSVKEAGFPQFTGGIFSYVEFRGHSRFIEDCKGLEQKYGERFILPEKLQ